MQGENKKLKKNAKLASTHCKFYLKHHHLSRRKISVHIHSICKNYKFSKSLFFFMVKINPYSKWFKLKCLWPEWPEAVDARWNCPNVEAPRRSFWHEARLCGGSPIVPNTYLAVFKLDTSLGFLPLPRIN